jgi:hypothetical protein
MMTGEHRAFTLGSPVTVAIELRNLSVEPILVNGRLAVGYPDGINRELYFRVFESHTGREILVPDTERVDVHRMPPKQEDFVVLSPRSATSTRVDVSVWCALKVPARYELVCVYDNDDDGAEFGVAAFVGTIESNRWPLVLQAPVTNAP